MKKYIYVVLFFIFFVFDSVYASSLLDNPDIESNSRSFSGFLDYIGPTMTADKLRKGRIFFGWVSSLLQGYEIKGLKDSNKVSEKISDSREGTILLLFMQVSILKIKNAADPYNTLINEVSDALYRNIKGITSAEIKLWAYLYKRFVIGGDVPPTRIKMEYLPTDLEVKINEIDPHGTYDDLLSDYHAAKKPGTAKEPVWYGLDIYCRWLRLPHK